MTRLTILRRGRGSISKLADGLGLTRGAVAKWDQVPAERVLKVEQLTGVSRHELRPDIYPLPENDVPATDNA